MSAAACERAAQGVLRHAGAEQPGVGEGQPLRRVRAIVGFDGFLDAIMDVVDVRQDAQRYTPIATIAQLAERIAAASGKSTNLELVTREVRFGGNGPLLAGGLGMLGAHVDYVGAVGTEDDPSQPHPAYGELQQRCASVHAIAPAARTDALEFLDGKVMLNHPANVQRVTWQLLRERVGLETLRALVGRADVLAVVNWSLMDGVEGIWRGLAEEVIGPDPRRGTPHACRVFVDLSDPAKRSDADVARGLACLRELQGVAPVTLGLNLAEALRVASVAGCSVFATRRGPQRELVPEAALDLRERLGLAGVVIHPREGAGGALVGADGAVDVAWVDGPVAERPVLSTGAGDHFNAGFVLGRCLGLDAAGSLAAGVATSGAYVRDGVSPDAARLAQVLGLMAGRGGGGGAGACGAGGR